jgi:crotonobetainyl-CoA:carnitine CoA-transferase CaiB-like acyl-CoA transferase
MATNTDHTKQPQAGAAHTGPLSGVKVLDLSIALTGPFAAALLADQGAQVVKVERPGIGDIARWVGVAVNNMSAFYLACNRGKRCIAVDLGSEEGQAIVLKLAAEADVVLQNFRPGVIDRLGLGYDAVSAVNPDVVYASISGYGPVGPYRDRSAYDTSIQAYAGFAATQAEPDGPPTFIKQNAAARIVAMRKNIRAWTPPRNRMPMAITAITMNAPMSGSASNKTPTTPTATPMGSTARQNFSLTSILRTM